MKFHNVAKFLVNDTGQVLNRLMLYRVKTHVNNEYSIYAILNSRHNLPLLERKMLWILVYVNWIIFLLLLMDNCNFFFNFYLNNSQFGTGLDIYIKKTVFYNFNFNLQRVHVKFEIFNAYKQIINQ